MKRIFSLLLSLCLLLSIPFASAEPRYPAKAGITVDAAAVLSASTVKDLEKLQMAFRREADFDLYIATVDFLDGYSLNEYAQGLAARWGLDGAALLLLVVGEDKFTLYNGKSIPLPTATMEKLLSTHFEEAFLTQRYDAAMTNLLTAMVNEVNKHCDTRISTSGLFGSITNQADWVERLTEWSEDMAEQQANNAESYHEKAEKQGNLRSLLKVLLTVALLMYIFGRNKDGKRRAGCLGTLLAGFGLFRLWKRH